MKKRCLVGAALAVVVAWAAAEPAGAESTAFTYQGQLLDGGVPYDGPVNLSFSIWTSISGGTMLAGPIDQAGVSVSDGLFSVPINVGNPSAVFNGDSRWLAITVNGTPLSPRQEIMPAPFAMFSSRPWETSGANISYNGGNVGIGTTSPTQRLTVAGQIQSMAGGFRFPDGTVQTTASTGGAGFWTPTGTNIFSNNTGNVGIGSSTPNHRLRVSGGPSWTANGWTGSLELDNSGAIAWRSNSGGQRFGIGQSDGGLYFFNSASDPGTSGSAADYRMLISDGGNVGIGTNFPATALDVRGDLTLDSGFSPGLFTGTGGAELNRYLLVLNSALFQSASGLKAGGVLVSDSFFYANPGKSDLIVKGLVGIGTPTPAFPLTIRTSESPFLNHYGWVHTDGTRELGSYVDGSGGWLGTRSSHPLYFFTANSGALMTLDTAGNLGIGTLTPTRRLDVNGTARMRVLEIIGADLAERFPAREAEEAEPGTVMEIDAEQAGAVRVARGAYNTRVAGVVSGANDFAAGAILGNLPGQEAAPAIALSGRVWVKCDAGAGAIAPGDLLTTSDVAGHAMKAVDRERAHGAVIGKAMSGLAAGERGLVLVLVNLQ